MNVVCSVTAVKCMLHGSAQVMHSMPSVQVAIATTLCHADNESGVEHAVALLANCARTEHGRHAAIMASTDVYIVNLLEMSTMLHEFKAGDTALSFVANMSMHEESRDHLLENDLLLPVVGLLKVPPECSWCHKELVLSALINLTASPEGRALAVAGTDLETVLVNLLLLDSECSHDDKLRTLVLAVLRNTSGSPRSITRSAADLIPWLGKRLDAADQGDVWDATQETRDGCMASSSSMIQRQEYVHVLALVSNICAAPSGALKVLHHDQLQRGQEGKGILGSLIRVLHGAGTPDACALDAAHAISNLALHATSSALGRDKRMRTSAIKALAHTLADDARGIELHEHVSHALTDVVGQQAVRTLVEAARKQVFA